MIQQSMFLDCTGAIASLVSTLLYIRINRYAWMTTIFASLINGWLYWQKGIYGDAFLEGTYLVSAVYGWMMWQDTIQTEPIRTKQLSSIQWIALILFIYISYVTVHFLFIRFTNSTVAHTDALTSVISLTAQWLMSHRFIASWGLWLIADLLYAYLYIMKNLTLHALLMGVYVIMAIIGYWYWRKSEMHHHNRV